MNGPICFSSLGSRAKFKFTMHSKMVLQCLPPHIAFYHIPTWYSGPSRRIWARQGPIFGQYSTPKFFDQLFLIRVYWNPKSKQGPDLACLPCRSGPGISGHKKISSLLIFLIHGECGSMHCAEFKLERKAEVGLDWSHSPVLGPPD